jgi:NADH-quinone oxidoreductase subunit L
VYLGVSDAAQLAANASLRHLALHPQGDAAGAHSITIVPGDGAVVAAMASRQRYVRSHQHRPGDELVITTIGPTVTFRELHDQLVMKDASGKEFLKEALHRTRRAGSAWRSSPSPASSSSSAPPGKSAQIPLYVWLPDAMAGPTPVSALIHAATMVTAGVYMIARLNFLFSLSPNGERLVAFVGASTALFAATIGFFQYDIKKVLAYSTVSQLGFMFIGVGVGAYWAGVFHLMTHAFFKACLFLGSGSVIHGMHAVEHDEVEVQDMRNMGGLKRVMPLTARTYFIACLAITAAPIPFFAGFWSKDEILWKAFNTESTGFPGWLIYAMGLAAALCTSFYMWRSYYLTFEGPHAKPEIAKKVHESPAAITYVLASSRSCRLWLVVLFGFSSHFLGGHGEPVLEQWLHPVLAHAETYFHARLGFEYAPDGGLGRRRHRLLDHRPLPLRRESRRRLGRGRAELPGFTLLQNKYYVDEIYQATIVKWFLGLRIVLAEMDLDRGRPRERRLRRRAWRGVGDQRHRHVPRRRRGELRRRGHAQGRRQAPHLQTGRIQNYVYGLLGGVAFFGILQYFLK